MSDEEDFVLYGTPLEPIEEDDVRKKKPRTVEDQVAKDKYGRRRFHGAFTGGFSAGYFNSVGSAEGWTPAAFKSSRGNKYQNQTQKPEDFMDDEDVGEFGIAPKVLRLKGDYDDGSEDFAHRKRKHFTGTDGPIPGMPVLHNLLKPVRSTIGVKLLKKMGWKVGQGIGPRLKKHEKRKLGQQSKAGNFKVYGCALPLPVENEEHHHNSSESDDNDEEDIEDITFAPDDYDPYIIKPKDNFFGIGYSGLDRRSILSSHINLFEPSFTVKEKSKKFSIRGQGFGVGALEEEDEDIYSHEDMSQYDFSLDSGSSTSKKQQNKQLLAITSINEPIEGFVAANFVIKKKFFTLPKLPQGYQPIHSMKKSRFEPAQRLEDKTKKQGLHRHDLSANERAIILDEPLPRTEIAGCEQSTSSTSGSVLVSTEDNNELQLHNIKKEPAENESINKISSGNVFKPFVSNPEKQKRYEQYLKLVKDRQKDKLSVLQPLSMTEWERERERVEFEQAERLYRPISAVFNDRFISASQPDDTTNPLAEVQRTIDEQKDLKEAAKMKMFGQLTRKAYSWAPSSLLCKRFNIREPNSTKEFDGKRDGKKRPKFSVFNFLEAAVSNTVSSSNAVSSSPENTDNSIVPNKSEIACETFVEPVLENVSSNRSNDKPPSTEENEKHGLLDINSEKVISEEMNLIGETNKEDLYKAIFLSSSDESEEEEQATEINKTQRDDELIPADDLSKSVRMNEESQSISNVQQSASVSNILRNTSPPRGIFANLDLDLINSRKSNNPISVSNNIKPVGNHEVIIGTKETSKEGNNSDTEKNEVKVVESSINSLPLYGPKLPSALSKDDNLSCNNKKSIKKIVDYNSDDSEESSDEWVESDTINKKHKNKKKKVKKDHKHKKHKKHKKHRH